MSNPSNPPQQIVRSTANVRLQIASFRWWYIVAGCIPFAIPFVFNTIYDPIDENWTVKTFGCSCPDLNGSYRTFNANHFNAIVWLVVFATSAYTWFRFCRCIVSPSPPWGLVLAPLGIVGFICLRHYAMGFWL